MVQKLLAWLTSGDDGYRARQSFEDTLGGGTPSASGFSNQRDEGDRLSHAIASSVQILMLELFVSLGSSACFGRSLENNILSVWGRDG